jgi:transcriptional regulator with XRE-family HTH domain
MGELRINQIQEKADISDAELARRMDTNQTQLKRLKEGDRRLTLAWLRRIAGALNCSVADLLSDEDVPDRISAADRKLIEGVRATHSDPFELLELLGDLDKFVTRQNKRRTARNALAGDEMLTAQFADLWAELNDNQRGHVLEMVRAAASMHTGISRAA